MEMIKIYHNPRCSKSRAGLAFLQEKNIDFEIVDYFKTPLTEKELAALIVKTGLPAEEMVRKQEDEYKQNYKDKHLTDKEWIAVITANPRLLKRPIVETKEKAIFAVPAENILRLL